MKHEHLSVHIKKNMNHFHDQLIMFVLMTTMQFYPAETDLSELYDEKHEM